MQKAAAYDKALKDIKAIYPNLKGDVKLAVEHAFPELKESEDEKIMGDIMEAVENWLPNERVEEIRAYLREHKPTKFGSLEYERGVKDGIHHAENHQWKPSEKQMNCLVVAASRYGNSEVANVLNSLIDDLEKL